MTNRIFSRRPAGSAVRRRGATAALVAAAAVSLYAFGAMGAAVLHAPAASLTRSIEVDADPSEVWSVIGPFCAIKAWLPPVGTCDEDHKSPPTRTLVTKDGAATFIELQTGRDDAAHFYSYTFRSSPLPVSNYNATIAVTANGEDRSIVTWNSTYTPDEGKEADAGAALAGIYDAGLNTIKARFTK